MPRRYYNYPKNTKPLNKLTIPTLKKKLKETTAEIEELNTEIEESKKRVAEELAQDEERKRKIEALKEERFKQQSLRIPSTNIIGEIFGKLEWPETARKKSAQLDVEIMRLESRLRHVETLQSLHKRAEAKHGVATRRKARIESAIRGRIKAQEREAAVKAATGQTRKHAEKIKKNLEKNSQCPYCGDQISGEVNADHIYPIALGGRSTPSNMVNVCSECNSKKSALTLNQFIAKYSLNRAQIESRLAALEKVF